MSDEQPWGQPLPPEYRANLEPPAPEQYQMNIPPPPGQFPPVAPPYPPHAVPWQGAVMPPARRSRRWWWIGGAVFVVVALIATGVTVLLLRGGGGGADNPQAAVLDFLAAAEKNDAFAAADLLDPSERTSVRSILDNTHNTAENTGYQQGGGRNGLLDGVRISADNVQTEVTNVRDDLARVTMTGGQITLAFDPAKANEGVRDIFSDKKQTERTWTADDLSMRARNSSRSVAPAVMTVKRSGKWYVSLLYSNFDMAARAWGKPATDPGRLDTHTYSSPEAAAKAFVDGLVGMFSSADVMKLAETLSPDEGTMIATYRDMFNANDLRRPIEDLRVVGSPHYDVQTKGSTATVTVSDLAFEYTSTNGTTRELEFPDCARNTSACRRTRLRELQILPGVAEVNRRGFVAAKDGGGWHIDLFASYANVVSEYLSNATKDEVALLIARFFDAPDAFLRLDAERTLKPGDSTTIDLKELPNTTGRTMAIVDLPVQSGQRYSITVSSSGGPGVDWFVVGKSGELADGASYSGPDSSYFSAPDDETLKVVLAGRSSGQSVTVSVRD